MSKAFSFAVVLVVSACTSARYHGDKNDPGYYQASQTRAVAYAEVSRGYAGGEEGAVAGLVMSALSLAANPDYYKDDFITGRCLCRFSGEGDFEIPCMNVTVALLDAEGAEVSRLFSSDGEFVFYADPKRLYRLKVHSDRYQTISAPKRISVGDDVSLHLTKK